MRGLTWILAVFGGIVSQSALAADATPAPSSTSSSSAADPAVLADAVRVALLEELAGDDVDRNALLWHVLEQDPEFAPARWLLGEMRAGDQWVPYRRFVDDEADRWHHLFLYRQGREERGDAVADHFHLANGARERGMWDEERAHLMRIVELEPEHPEARRRLGDVKIDGCWVAREEMEAYARRLVQTRQDLDAWSPEVDRIVTRLMGARREAWDRAWEDLAAIREPAAIPAVERALAEGDERAAHWYLDWLSGLDAWEASVALARQAVLSPSAAVRVRAQRLLRERPIDEFVPMLLGAMRDNLNLDSRLFVTAFGGLAYIERVVYETQDEVRGRSLVVHFGPEDVLTPLAMMPRSALPVVRDPEVRAAVLSHLQKHDAFDPREGRALESATEIANERASRTIAAAMQVPELDSPRAWWDWWIDYEQVYVSGIKPELAPGFEEIRSTEYNKFYRAPRRIYVSLAPYPPPQLPPPDPNRRRSCFAAGTPVITEYGPKPIEEILLGDRVLAQDVETGEIAFKPVFKTTVRPPVALVTITTEDGALTCTGGHPFWINGHGWRYAWELQPGMRFHSIDGSSEIISIEDSGREGPAYNLVIADYHNYFVGEGRILSHDNSPRNPTNALVPGLMPDWSAAVQE